jgi:hypothetical protein
VLLTGLTGKEAQRAAHARLRAYPLCSAMWNSALVQHTERIGAQPRMCGALSLLSLWAR